jgi:hypothetical protein
MKPGVQIKCWKAGSTDGELGRSTNKDHHCTDQSLNIGIGRAIKHEPAAAHQPTEGAHHDPATGQNLEAFTGAGTFVGDINVVSGGFHRLNGAPSGGPAETSSKIKRFLRFFR